MNTRTKGIIIIFAGIVCVSPDAVLVRFLSEGGADPWSIIFWKLLLSIPWTLPYAIYETKGLKPLWESIVVGRWYYVPAVPIQAAINMSFTFSFVFTSAANALLLINLNPLWCAIVGRIFLGDELPKRTIIALVLALGCILIIFVPEVIERRRNTDATEEEAEGSDVDSGKGNIIAFFTGFLLAAYITIIRKSGKSSKNINLVGAPSLGSTLATIISVSVNRGNVMPSLFWSGGPIWQFWLAVTAQGFGIGALFIAMAVSPRMITGAEIGMVVLLEVVLGPLFVFLAYGEAPSKWTLIGGLLLLLVLAIHESRPLFDKAKQIRRSLSRHFSSRMGSAIESSNVEPPMVDGNDDCDGDGIRSEQGNKNSEPNVVEEEAEEEEATDSVGATQHILDCGEGMDNKVKEGAD